MTQMLLIVHIAGAFIAGGVSVLAIRAAVSRNLRASFFSKFLSGVFVIDMLTGLSLALSTATPVLTVCDNLLFYALVFALIQGFVFWRGVSSGMRIKLSPLYAGIGIPAFSVGAALLAGF